MKSASSLVFSSLCAIALAAAMACMPAHADDYSDVSQLVRAGKQAEALTRADQYLATQPKDPQMRFLKGVIQRDSGKTTEAIATFTKLTEDYPELPEPYNNLAVLYAGQSQFDKARAALEMAIRTNPSYATAHENLGDIYAKLASQAYNKALQLDNANPAVPPKLALIREIFGANASKAQRTASAPAGTVALAQNSVGKPASTAPPAASATPSIATPATPPAKATATPVTPVPATVPPVVRSTPPAPVTPPKATESAPASKFTTPAPATTDSAAQVQEVEVAVSKWAKAWSARDVKSYLAAYGKDFDPPGSISRKTWEEERKLRITSKASITVKIDNLNVRINGNQAIAKFRQSYKAGELAVSSRKTLELDKVGGRWQIVKETVGN